MCPSCVSGVISGDFDHVGWTRHTEKCYCLEGKYTCGWHSTYEERQRPMRCASLLVSALKLTPRGGYLLGASRKVRSLHRLRLRRKAHSYATAVGTQLGKENHEWLDEQFAFGFTGTWMKNAHMPELRKACLLRPQENRSLRRRGATIHELRH